MMFIIRQSKSGSLTGNDLALLEGYGLTVPHIASLRSSFVCAKFTGY